MKRMKVIIAIMIAATLSACAPGGEKCPPVDMEKELSEIRFVLEQYELAREREDFATVEHLWAEEADIVLFGTVGNEQLVGIEAIKKAMSRQFNEFENTLINISEQMIRINEAGTVAWFSEVLDYSFIYMGEHMIFEGMRFTGVLEKKEDKWKLVQGHLSVPYESAIEENNR